MRKPGPPKPSISVCLWVCLFFKSSHWELCRTAPRASWLGTTLRCLDEQTQDLGAAFLKRGFCSPEASSAAPSLVHSSHTQASLLQQILHLHTPWSDIQLTPSTQARPTALLQRLSPPATPRSQTPASRAMFLKSPRLWHLLAELWKSYTPPVGWTTLE